MGHVICRCFVPVGGMLQKIIVYDKDKNGNIREKPEMGVMVRKLTLEKNIWTHAYYGYIVRSPYWQKQAIPWRLLRPCKYVVKMKKLTNKV